MLTMMNDNDTASEFKATIRILLVLIIHVWPNSRNPLFGKAILTVHMMTWPRLSRLLKLKQNVAEEIFLDVGGVASEFISMTGIRTTTVQHRLVSRATGNELFCIEWEAFFIIFLICMLCMLSYRVVSLGYAS